MLKTKEVGASREGAFSCCPANLPRSVYKHLLLAQGVTVGGVSIGHVSRRHRYNAQIKEEKVASFDDWFFPAEETLYVNGKAVVVANETYDVSSARIFAYHKPENVVADANRGSKLYGIGSEIMTRYGVENRPFPIGQLDKNTTGLLLFTTNGHVQLYKLARARSEDVLVNLQCTGGQRAYRCSDGHACWARGRRE